MRFGFTSGSALLFLMNVSAQPTDDTGWTREYEGALKKCQNSTSCIELVALTLFPMSADEPCATTMQRAALLLFNRSPEDVERLGKLTELAGCDTSYSQLRYNLGMLEWRKGNLREAERHFLQGVDLVSAGQKAVWLTAAGAVAYEENRIEIAMNRFIEAYQLDSVNAAPMLLNNLSALALRLDNLTECALWGERALSRYAEFENDIDAGVGPEFSQYVHFNLFVAYTTMQNVQEATNHWERLDFKDLNVHPIQLAELLSMFARLTDQPALMELHGEPLRRRIIGFEESGRLGNITYLKDPLVSLFTKEAAPFVDSIGLQEAWTQLLPHFALRSTETPEEEDLTLDDEAVLWSEGAFWGLVILGLALVALYVRARTANLAPSPPAPWVQLMNRMTDEPLNTTDQEVLEGVLLDIERHRKVPDPSLHDSPALNDSERIALRDGIRGVFPKITAQNHNWSPTYVYILRSSVRSKLGISPSISFARWEERFPELARQALQSTPKNDA